MMVNRPDAWATTKKLIRSVTPPFLFESARRLRNLVHPAAAHEDLKELVEWEYVPQGWQAEKSDPRIKGWNVESVLEAYKANWPAFLRQLERALPLGISPDAAIPSQ